ncbi:hypothetical protein BDR26DRAFT_809226 [Obelidium mucronatum]|nr:hypothetical protein BDR26DRAFT_809226 [Obelidium mucronatum]
MSYSYNSNQFSGTSDEDDDGDDDDAGLFAPAMAAPRDAAPLFAVLSEAQLRQSLHDAARDVAGVLGIAPSLAAVLLRFFRGNKDRLLEDYYAKDASQLLEQAGVRVSAAGASAPPAAFECQICYDDTPTEKAALNCNHAFCKSCYSQYLHTKIVDEGEAARIQCPDSKCHVLVDEESVEGIVDPSVFRRYKNLLLKAYVDDTPSLKWCPHPNCEYAVSCKISPSSLEEIVPSVACGSGHAFCFGCSLAQDHQPCVCSLVKLWLKKCADDSETANWISANTKECEKCQSTIEKNGGCNHMTCRKCKYEFCWVCMGPWSDHGTQWYNCNRFDEKVSIDARDTQAKYRAALERYLHYFNRYANHEQSAKLDKELSEKIEKKMLEMQKNSALSWIEVQFLATAKSILLQSRNTLKWTYCFAYYLTRNNSTFLFEDNQRDLEMAVEQLSEMLESNFEPDKILELKQAVLDKSVYVAGRREVLLNATAADLLEGKFVWSAENSAETLSLAVPPAKKK